MAKEKKIPFAVLKKGAVGLAMAGMMAFTPFIAGCSEPGEKGDNGANGKSAYELAVENGFEGTLEQWLASLKGETGANGYTHVKYANSMPDNDADILATGTGDYIGIYSGTSATAPTSYTEYSWFKIKGETPVITFDDEGYILIDGVNTGISIFAAEFETDIVYNRTTSSNYEFIVKQGNALGTANSINKRVSMWFEYKFKAGTTFKFVGDDTNYKYGFSISSDGEHFDARTQEGAMYAEDTGWIYAATESGGKNISDPSWSTVKHYYDADTKTLTLSRDSYVRINFCVSDETSPLDKDDQDWANYFEINGKILESAETIHITPDQSNQVSSYGMNSIAYRGYSAVAPENTLAAYRLAHEKGFEMVSCDVSFTSDGVGVLLHDETIDRTSNGTGNIAEMTLNDVLEYDFGSWKSGEYVGEKIAKFEDFIKLCKYLALHPYIQVKSGATQDNIESLVTTVFRAGMLNKVTWVSSDMDVLNAINTLNAKARLGYVTENITETQITELKALKTETNEVFFYANNENLILSIVDRCIAEYLPLEVYTVDEVEDIENLHPYVTGVASSDKLAGQILYDKYMGK